eukprot:Skav229696  [mRNA]  locus=scaffold3722:232744:236019:- [translate_table: standard]
MFGRSWSAFFLLLLSVSAELGDLTESCEESDDLRVSLLQSSLQVAKMAKAPVKNEDIDRIDDRIDRDASIEAVKQHNRMFNPYIEVSENVKMLAKKHLSFVAKAMMLPTEKTALSGIPALLVFMLAGLVMALFVVQLIGVMFDDKSKETPPFQPGQRYGYPAAPSTAGQGSLPPLSVPPSRASMGVPVTAPSTMQTLPQRDAAGRPSQAPNPSQMFTDVKDKRWLQLSTTSNSRFPHCCAGPLEVASDAMVEVRGPKGDRFGTLEKGHDATWYLHRSEGPLVHRISMMGGSLIAMDRSLLVGTGKFTPHAFDLTVSPGRDPLLTLVSMMIIILTSPDIRR